MPKLLIDVVERTVAAYATTFLGLLLATGFDLTNLSAVKAAAIASIPAALSIVKGVVGAMFGNPTTAAWLPADKPSGPTSL